MSFEKPDRFTGEPKLYLSENGADMDFRGGQPVMDAGLENAVQISLFTREGWFGNAYLLDREKVGSRVEKTAEQSITATSLADMEREIRESLKWMIDTSLAEEIEVTVGNPTGRAIQAAIVIRPPAREAQTLLLLRNGTNWINQTIDPAYRK